MLLIADIAAAAAAAAGRFIYADADISGAADG